MLFSSPVISGLKFMLLNMFKFFIYIMQIVMLQLKLLVYIVHRSFFMC